ncbi:uncharacterized protein LOC100368185 [Saccoglossus kowalevskii]|uniref:Tyrosine-protein kinase BTK-like n=1 Tax=Saccoglossus kowalevskii TaxID=10224 RepID=A0ABM0MD70_SACKO|nr:PREDICTED: tyrosine-protein kinase BTK-like [Saccoglossus kowalevskii]
METVLNIRVGNGRGRGRAALYKDLYEQARRPDSSYDKRKIEPNSVVGTSSVSTGPGSVSERQHSLVSDRKIESSTEKQSEAGACNNNTDRIETAKVVRLLAKYSYKAHPDKPGGFPELTIRQAQNLVLINKHCNNMHWWNVRDENGNEGYVPASYMKVMEEKPSVLPWLQNKVEENEVKENVFGAPPKGSWKPYKSAYADTDKAALPADKYYCKLCDKRLNGPKPYSAHMASKAHKEEEEYVASNN